jgi:hypothetical protein
MKNKKCFFIFFWVLSLTILSSCTAVSMQPAATEGTTESLASSVSSSIPDMTATIVIPTETLPAATATATVIAPTVATLVNETIESPADSTAYTIQLEKVKMDGDASYADPFNTLVQAMMEVEQKNFLDGIAEIEEWRAANMPDIRSTLDNAVTITYNDHSLVSVHFEFFTYTAGAAHPFSYSKTLTYDMNTRQVVELEQLFTSGSDWMNAVSSYCINDLTAKGVYEFLEGATPTPENYSRWSITPDGLVIYFDPYQVAAYAAGPQQVTIPYASLADYIASPGLIAHLVP